MNNIKIKLENGQNIIVTKGIKLNDIIKEYNLEKDIPVVLGKLNGKIYELSHTVDEGGKLEIIDISSKIGRKTYIRTLQFILIKAVNDIFPNSRITIEHSLGKGLFGEIDKEQPLNEGDIKKIKARMDEIIKKDIIIKKISVTKNKAMEIFKKYRLEDKLKLFKNINAETLNLYELDGLYDYFYGAMAYSTGVIKNYDLVYHKPGFKLRFPTQYNPYELPPILEHKKLEKIFYETEQWGKILNVGDVGSLNDIVLNGNISELIRVNEALQEKKIAYISDMIKEKENVKLVLIAGPSSSGKTTFTKRLGIQLRTNGFIPVQISLDDYFVDRHHTPKDEFGEYDFESIFALDLELFNKNLTSLLNYEETEIPKYDFKTGKRVWTGDKVKLPERGIILIEGIHGLNEMLTSSISKENKFKIYISCLTQLNIDCHNRIPTTDVRIIRRIVRDSLSRGYGAETTLKMWSSIRRGEERNIFPFQEEADVMFNSNLVYEISILKKHALRELNKIHEDSPIYYEACRLKNFLYFFKEIDESLVPDNSILREFIGGSYFYKY